MLKKVIGIIPLVAMCIMFLAVMPGAAYADVDVDYGWDVVSDVEEHPQEMTLVDGSATLKVKIINAKAGETFTYQWYYAPSWQYDEEPIDGAVNSVYTATKAGDYMCVATDSAGNSEGQTFHVHPSWCIEDENGVPLEGVITERLMRNGSVDLQVVPKGFETGMQFTYYWSSMNPPNIIDGAVSSTYTATEQGRYECAVVDSNGVEKYVQFEVCKWDVETPEKMTLENGSATIRVSVINAEEGLSFSYQWYEYRPDAQGYYDAFIIPGATSPELTVTKCGSYMCSVTDSEGDSNAGRVDVSGPEDDQDISKPEKLANPMKIKPVTKTVKYSKLKKKAQTVTGAIKFTKKAKGTVTYKGVGTNAKSKKALKINTKTGKITVKKKTKKGTYKMKVIVKAAGTSKGDPQYKALSKTVTVTIKVK